MPKKWGGSVSAGQRTTCWNRKEGPRARGKGPVKVLRRRRRARSEVPNRDRKGEKDNQEKQEAKREQHQGPKKKRRKKEGGGIFPQDLQKKVAVEKIQEEKSPVEKKKKSPCGKSSGDASVRRGYRELTAGGKGGEAGRLEEKRGGSDHDKASRLPTREIRMKI